MFDSDTIPAALSKTLFVSDLDGTLMDNDSRLSGVTARVLDRLIADRGMRFTVATARTPATVVPIMGSVAADLPFVVMAGAALWDNSRQRYTDVLAIPDEVVEASKSAFARHGLHPFVYRRRGNIIIARHNGAMSDGEREFVDQRKDTPHKRFVLDAPDDPADEAMLIFALSDYASLESVFADLKASTRAQVMLYHDSVDPAIGLLEVYREGCTKAAAIRRLARQTGADRVVAFGDNLNDILMLRDADLAVAVGNAVPEVKAVADRVIGINTDDSVARFLADTFHL